MTKTDGRGFTRRDLLRGGSLAAAGLLWGLGESGAQGARPLGIDIHAHLWTDQYLDLVTGYGKTDTNTQRGRGAGLGDRELEARFALMDTSGVDLQVLSVSPQVPHFEEKAHAVTAARHANDLYADAVRRWPKRFKAFAALPMPHVDEALKELDRALGSLGMVGVTLTTSILRRSVADPAFLPIYEELNRRGSILFLHPEGKAAYSHLLSDYSMTWMFGAIAEDTIAVLHLIAQGIPQRFPRLKIINSHIGGGLVAITKRLDSISTWEYPKMPERPSLAVRRMWYDTVSYGDVAALRAAVDTLGAGQLVLGSDFPYESGDVYRLAVSYIGQAGLKAADVAGILGRNASTLLGRG